MKEGFSIRRIGHVKIARVVGENNPVSDVCKNRTLGIGSSGHARVVENSEKPHIGASKMYSSPPIQRLLLLPDNHHHLLKNKSTGHRDLQPSLSSGFKITNLPQIRKSQFVPTAKQPWSWLKESWNRKGGKELASGETGLGLTLCVVAVVSVGEVWELRLSSSVVVASVMTDEISESEERSSELGAELSAMNGGRG
nr:probable WRKY transcription factor 7 [Ipomoea batatas]